MPGARNLIFRKDRSHRDLLRFSIPSDFASETIDELAERLIPEGWFGVRVESGETRLSTLCSEGERGDRSPL